MKAKQKEEALFSCQVTKCDNEADGLRIIQEENPEAKKFIEKLNAYISEHLESQITVTDLASFFNMSTRNLYRRFSDIGLPSPNEYIIAFRLNDAARLLRTTSLSIKEIMYDCGFNTKGHFYSEFEKKYAMTPKQYKLQYLDSEEQSHSDR